MRETERDLRELQALLDHSFAGAGAHLRGIFDEDHRPTAQELVDELDSVFEMHLACVTPDGAPLVAPLDGIFHRGRIWFGLPGESVRARLVRREPRVSASFNSDTFAFIVHGTATEVRTDDDRWPEFEALLIELYVAQYGPWWAQWYESRKDSDGAEQGFGGFIEPRAFFAKS